MRQPFAIEWSFANRIIILWTRICVIISSDWWDVAPRSRVRERYIFEQIGVGIVVLQLSVKNIITPKMFIVVLFVLVVSNAGVLFWCMDSLRRKFRELVLLLSLWSGWRMRVQIYKSTQKFLNGFFFCPAYLFYKIFVFKSFSGLEDFSNGRVYQSD